MTDDGKPACRVLGQLVIGHVVGSTARENPV